MIGHMSYKLPEALDNGSLAWLGGFSSGLTEIVYLGETWSNEKGMTNKRIEFLQKNGFKECAAAYRAYAFPRLDDTAVSKLAGKLVQMGYRTEEAERMGRDALAQRAVSKALLENRLSEYASSLYPPFLAYPDAWKAYIAHYE